MRIALPCAVVLLLCAGAASAASPSAACDAKRVRIEAQLADAETRGRSPEIAGLKRALKAHRANCTDASLARERDRDIRQAQREVAKREQDLADAERKGKADKVATRKAKLDEARRQLAEAEKPL